jgi:uncharacterized phage-like protein YoqJ
MGKIVCFTGHRKITDQECDKIHKLVYQAIEEQIQSGADIFRAGGALGFDTIAALNVLLLRRHYPHIRLELILPCPTQTRGWAKNDTILYEQIIAQADSHRYISQQYWDGVLQLRNRALVEGSDICISYLRSSHGGGAAFTAALALRKGLELINIFDRF